MAISTYLASVWTATEFDDPELSGYAESELRSDTRVGVQAVAGLSLAMQIFVVAFVLLKNIGNPYLYISMLFALLSVHVLISSFYLQDVRAIQTLGMAFLIIGALCLTSIAHQSGELQVGVMAATVMLFVAVPLVPWALREAVTIIGLTYALLTMSLIVVPGRFTPESLWGLQLLILGSAVIAVFVTARNTFIRKHDLRARYELEIAHSDLERLSMQDHLTGAWNRRFLSENFGAFAKHCMELGKSMHVAVLDIDNFKRINDDFGHQFGDKILICVADIFVRLLAGKGSLIRLGGDEFQIIYCGDGLDNLIETAVDELQQQFAAAGLATEKPITLSAGIVSSEPGQLADLEALYRTADSALYQEKHNRSAAANDPLARTGTWQL